MYSFEGEYRRKPEQCLGGASIKTEREELLHHARLQRQKREDIRKRTKSTILIQAYIRSYLCRLRIKRLQRDEFDNLSYKLSSTSDDYLLELLIKKLLFFYNIDIDNGRLVKISQFLLKQYPKILQLSIQQGKSWSWYIKCLLNLNLKYIVHTVQLSTLESMAVPLRVIETFSSLETVEKVLGKDQANDFLGKLFEYLVAQGYFEHVRLLLDAKTPPLVEVTTSPPTPVVSCLFDMIVRPLQIGNCVTVQVFGMVLRGLCRHIFSPKLTDAVKLFVIPALAELSCFPFHQMIEALNDEIVIDKMENIPKTTSLLFSILTIEKKHILSCCEPNTVQLSGFLLVLATLTSNMCKLSSLTAHTDILDMDNDVDDDADMDIEQNEQENLILKEEIQILEECVILLNEPSRVQNLLLAVDQSEEPIVLQALCQVCHNLLISDKSAIHKYRLLYMFAFKSTFFRHLWSTIQRVSQTSVFGCATPLLNIISKGIPMSAEDTERIVPLLAVFCSLFSLLIATLHDSEFYGDDNGVTQSMPFSLSQLVTITRQLKDVCLGLVDLAYPDSRSCIKDSIQGVECTTVPAHHTHLWSNLFKVVVGLVRQLHSRDNRRPFCREGHWISQQVRVILGVYQPCEFSFRRRIRGYRPFQGLRAFTREELEIGPPLTTKEVRTATILNELPFLVAFEERVMIFQTIISKDKMEHQGERIHFMQGPNIQISVRRNYLYEDAFDKLSFDNEPELRLKMRVQLVNVAGLSEAGVDGGGLFREFLTELLKTAFDPNRGFFKLTKDNSLYPNPNVHLLVEDFPKHYFFIGRILGKALYENLLVELPLAEFFLTKIVGRHSDVDIHHLASLDPIMYRNLLFLKRYDGDVLDLGLDFTVINDELGETRMEELKAGGANIPVTSSNRIEYIHLMADHKLNKQIRAQCNSFRQGLSNVIPLEWIQMFNNKELQVLISGAEIPVDVDDLRQHTTYTGGYTSEHHTIKIFWKVLSNFTDLQKRQLLKFVTSCSRPPLLGFKELDPPFCIQHAGTIDRLPTASTCMNLLKLPEFPDEKLLTDKLVYAIQSGSGFELS